jgi:GDP-L-fucose synthase
MFYHGKQVLVTGGSGFVGSHLVEALLTKGAKVRVPIHHHSLRVGRGVVEEVPADLMSYEACLNLLDGIDYVFHAAGSVGAAGVGPSDQMALINENLQLAGNIMRACWEAGTERLLLYGSSTGYPDVQYQVREEEMWDGPPHPAYMGYGWMRRYLEKIAEFVSSRSSLKIALVRPTAIYGERDASQHVIPSLIRRALSKEDPLLLWGDGSEVRDFLHVADLVRGSLMLLEKHAVCDPVNIGYGETCTIREVLSMILRYSGYTGCRVHCDESKPSTIRYRAVSIDKAKQLLGFAPQITLEEGLSRTVAYYQNILQFREPHTVW